MMISANVEKWTAAFDMLCVVLKKKNMLAYRYAIMKKFNNYWFCLNVTM